MLFIPTTDSWSYCTEYRIANMPIYLQAFIYLILKIFNKYFICNLLKRMRMNHVCFTYLIYIILSYISVTVFITTVTLQIGNRNLC